MMKRPAADLSADACQRLRADGGLETMREGASVRLHHMFFRLCRGGGRGGSYYACPQEDWQRIRTNNPLERLLREITHVVGAFPDGQSALNLAAARLRHVAGTAWSTNDT